VIRIPHGATNFRLATLALFVVSLLVIAGGCGGADAEGGRSGSGGGRPAGGRPGGPPGGMASGGQAAVSAVPVEVATVARGSMSSYIETNGTLEAENEVDIVARTAGPIEELLVEEGMRVRRGQVLARLEQDEIRAQLEISRVTLDETRLAFERAQQLAGEDLISTEEFERARAAHDSARAQYDGNRLQLGFTEIKAPFEGLLIARYVDFAQNVSANTPLFRLSDFTPLLCPIQVPERELGKLRQGQSAYLTVESFPDDRFEADVLRISPVVDPGTGTIKVTLEVQARGKLRPGMFARVYLETATRENTLVVPKAALSLESIGDTVYVAGADGVASRREVRLGFDEGDFVEVLEGLAENENVVVVGQDGLSEGTPVQILGADGAAVETSKRVAGGEAIEQRMRSRGMSDEQIAERLRSLAAGDGAAGSAGREARRGGGPPDFSSMTPEQLERVKQRMRSRGMTEAQIEARIDAAGDGKGGSPEGSSATEGSGDSGRSR